MKNKLKPLAGYKILDLTWVYSGPYCTSLLLDLGADVIKVEGPKSGDHTRTFPPFKNSASGYFYSLNRGKKSIAINLKSEEGKKLIYQLVEHADVITENFVPGVMEKLGLGYEKLKEINPKIIYASIHGFGSWGPYSKRQGVDPVAQAMGGLMSQSGFKDGAPLKTGPAVADALSGIYLALGIVTALIDREKSGVGHKIEVGMMDAVFSVLEESVIRTSMTGDALPRRGNTDPLGAPWDAFKTKDNKWVMICAFGGNNFEKVYTLMGREDLVAEYSGDSEEAIQKRSDDLDKLNNIFADWALNYTSEELVEIISSLHIPCGVVKDIVDLLDDPHLKARNMIAEVDHPKLGKIKTYNMPIMFDQNNFGIIESGNVMDPEIGEHNEEVLKALLKLSDKEIDRLYSNGAIWTKN